MSKYRIVDSEGMKMTLLGILLGIWFVISTSVTVSLLVHIAFGGSVIIK